MCSRIISIRHFPVSSSSSSSASSCCPSLQLFIEQASLSPSWFCSSCRCIYYSHPSICRFVCYPSPQFCFCLNFECGCVCVCVQHFIMGSLLTFLRSHETCDVHNTFHSIMTAQLSWKDVVSQSCSQSVARVTVHLKVLDPIRKCQQRISLMSKIYSEGVEDDLPCSQFRKVDLSPFQMMNKLDRP